jgi:hypothetical protein
LLVSGARGQALLETLVTIGIAGLTLGAVVALELATTRGLHASEERPIELAAIANTANELQAAVEYDANALAAVGAASWSALPPSPPPGAPAPDALPLALSGTTAGDGTLVTVRLNVSSGTSPAASDTFYVQQRAPAPGSLVELTPVP